jgi:N12 class adenine-specific DNA methylase
MQTLTNLEQDTQGSADPSSTIVELVELVKNMQREQRQATNAESALLANWMGWGPVAPAFESSPKGTWAEVGARLRLLLGPEGADAASAATPTSFFTTRYIASTVWQLATGLGFTGGRVLEPGCGSGAILAAAPAGLSLDIMGIEREPFSASVAQIRHPSARIITSPFEKVSIVNDSFDLVVGNVPFSSVRVYDPDSSINFSLHTYFLWRALAALRPGGLAVLLTSRYTLDAKREMPRDLLGHRGILLGALRLPSGALQEAGTQVITDILVLQRRAPDIAWQGQKWMNVVPDVVPGVDMNEYFQQSPRHIIGTPTVIRGMYRDDELGIVAPSNVAEALSESVENIVEIAQSNGATYLPPPDYTTISENLVRRREDGRKEGSYHLLGSRLVQIRDGEPQPVTRNVAELTMLVQLRKTAIELLEAERDLDRPDSDLAPKRTLLNACYDAYVRTYGPIHRATISTGQPDPETGEQTIITRRPPALSAFRQDPDYAVVLGLEQYDTTTQEARKAQIFRSRVHVRPPRKTVADSPGEALALCLDEHGSLNFEGIGRLLSIDAADVPSRLGDLVYEDPASGTWLTAQEYLSGNVRVKLEEAQRAAAEQAERFARNVAALEAIVPEDLEPEEIRAVLGAPWIPPADIEQFCLDTFGVRPVVEYESLTAIWEMTLSQDIPLAAISEWGTRRVNAFSLVETGLNKSVPVIYDSVGDTKVRNVEETLAAQEKLRVIQARFSEWVWEDDERANRLATVYNRLFHSVVPRVYDGSHLSFPGMDETWANALYPWQRDFVWRMVSSPSALCGHPVGAGKTTTEIAGAMTLRRFGLISKAAIVVPNHLLEQITAEAQRLYPGARVLMVSRDDLARERRTLFAARVALEDYDFVVMTHACLGALGVHPETEKAYLEKRIAVYRQALLDLDEEDTRRKKRSIKRLETTIEKMRQRQRELLDMPRDDGVTFEQLGVSYLIIDESHIFKNLGLPTKVCRFNLPNEPSTWK